MTGTDIIKRSLRLIGAIGVGETPTAAELQDGLTALNGLIGQWATQRLTIYVTNRTLFDLVDSQQNYTIGSGGNFNVARPLFLSRASIISQTDSDQPLELPMKILSTQQWQQQVPVKNVESTIPQWLYYNYANPLGTLSFWPIPSGGNLQVALYLPTALTEFSTGATEQSVPLGYADALAYQLAIRLATEYGRPVPPEVGALAMETLANIKRANIRITQLQTDMGLRSRRDGQYNFLSDQPV